MTQEEYYRDLDYVRENNPGEVLLATLERGYSVANCVYLRAALGRVVPKSDTEQDDEAEDAATDERPDDPKWNELTRAIREGFEQIRKIHNKYFDCNTEQEFARNAKRMHEAWESTQQAIKARKAYEQGVPAYEPDEEIPDNPLQLTKMLLSLRVKRKQHQDKILELAKKGDEDKVKAKETSLLKIKNLLLIVEEKLKGYEHTEVL